MLPAEDLREVRRYADLLLKEADAYRCLPTPVWDIISAAALTVDTGFSLDQRFLHHIYQGVTEPVKRAVLKVSGLLDARDRRIYVDHSVHPMKKIFICLHEAGHGFLPWQRDAYMLLEDDDTTLNPYTKELFERQANVFASEVLFQLNQFQEEAADLPFSIKTPVELSKRYGTSCYAAARRFVNTHHKACALLVLDEPLQDIGTGHTLTLRRFFQSKPFTELFGTMQWPGIYGPDHAFMSLLPTRYNFSETQRCQLINQNREPERCFLETFNSGYNNFVFIYPESELENVA